MASDQSPPSASDSDIEVFMFAHATPSNPTPSIPASTLSAFSSLVKDSSGLTLIPKPASEGLLSPRVARLVYRPFKPSSSSSSPSSPPPATPTDLLALRQSPALVQFESSHNIELLLLPWKPSPRPLRLAVFDMDSTLIDQEVIDELARTIGKVGPVAEITERAMRGELDFAESLRARVRLLEGVRADVWEGLRARISVAEGARELCRALAARGVVMAVFSGGFQPMAEWLKGELGLDVAVANHTARTLVDDGLFVNVSRKLVSADPNSEYPFAHLTGALVPDIPIVTAERKRTLTRELAREHSIPLSEVLCVGDGANDLLMLNAVGEAGGVAVACKAKEKVQREAPNRLNGKSLADLIYVLGLQELKEG